MKRRSTRERHILVGTALNRANSCLIDAALGAFAKDQSRIKKVMKALLLLRSTLDDDWCKENELPSPYFGHIFRTEFGKADPHGTL